MSGRVAGIAAAAAAGYAVLWLGYLKGWAWLADADGAALRTAHDLGAQHPGWVTFWTVVSAVLGPTSLRLMALVGIVVALVGRRPRAAGFLALAVLGMGLVTTAAKSLADRPRPLTALVAAGSSAFPSGHALGIMVAALAFFAVLAPALSRPARRWAAAGGLAAVLLVGAARVALNVHHPTDVLAGWALGYLWFLVCVIVVPPDPGRPHRPARR